MCCLLSPQKRKSSVSDASDCVTPVGKGLVPEQEDEVEAGERRPAGGAGPGERTGQCEKGHAAALGVLWHRGPPPLHGLLSQ